MDLILLKDIVSSELEELIDPYVNSQIKENNVGVYEGIAGHIILFHKYYHFTKDEKFLKKINYCILKSIKIIEKSENLDPSFSSGLAGLGWSLQYLKETDYNGFDLDLLLAEIDSIIERSIISYLQYGDLDSFYGVLGMSKYLLKRKSRRQIAYIIEYLDTHIVNLKEGGAWETFNKNKSKSEYNFSLAHGITGVLYFLNKCLREGYQNKTCIKLIKRAVEFILSNKRPHLLGQSFFPGSISIEDYQEGVFNKSYTRLGWCYGDLGVFYILLLSACSLNDDKLKSEIIRDVCEVLKRKTYNNTMIVDASFCHGAIGVAYISKKLYCITKKKIFQKAYHFWLKESLKFKNKGTKIGWTYFHGNDLDWSYKPSKSLLMGNGGIILVFLDFLKFSKNDWDECFMLDI